MNARGLSAVVLLLAVALPASGVQGIRRDLSRLIAHTPVPAPRHRGGPQPPIARMGGGIGLRLRGGGEAEEARDWDPAWGGGGGEGGLVSPRRSVGGKQGRGGAVKSGGFDKGGTVKKNLDGEPHQSDRIEKRSGRRDEKASHREANEGYGNGTKGGGGKPLRDPSQGPDGRRRGEKEKIARGGSKDGARGVHEVPCDIDVGTQVSCFALHPRTNIIAVGLASGEVSVYMYGTKKHQLVTTIPPPKTTPSRPAGAGEEAKEGGDGGKSEAGESGVVDDGAEAILSCRCVAFGARGARMYRACGDGTVEAFNMRNISDEGVFERIWRARGGGEAVSCLRPIGGGRVLAGYDDGTVALLGAKGEGGGWTLKPHADQVTSVVVQNGEALFGSADGTVSAVHIERGKLVARSMDVGEEVLCLGVVKEGGKVLGGLSSGAVAVWRWGEWDAPSDRLPGHLQAVNCLHPLDSDTYLTGSDDGVVRLMQVHPNRIIAVVGGHAEDPSQLTRKGRGDFPVECIGVERRGRFACSSSHDGLVRFHDIASLSLEEGGAEDSDEDDGERKKRRKKRGRTKSKGKKADRARRATLDAIERRSARAPRGE